MCLLRCRALMCFCISFLSIIWLPRGPARSASAAKSSGSPEPVVDGREIFNREWVPKDPRCEGDGLGPMYNDTSCVGCHNLGGVGGGGAGGKNVDILSPRRDMIQRKATKTPPRHSLAELHPGFRRQSSVVLHRFSTDPSYELWRSARLSLTEVPKSSADIVGVPDGRRQATLMRSQRNPTALFGAGLIDTIPDDVLKDAAKTSHKEFSEVKGRVCRMADGRIGRFGWKAQTASLKEFTLTACAVELGLEVPDHPQGGHPLQPDYLAPGLDLTESECQALVAFIAGLPRPVETSSHDHDYKTYILGGRTQFLRIGCAECHRPSLGGVEGIYSDLLLHDMSESMGDVGSYGVFRETLAGTGHRALARPVSPATAQEWRTPPLWGCRDSAPYMHDGSAETLEAAVALHGGEAFSIAMNFNRLLPDERMQIVAFLKTLAAPPQYADVALENPPSEERPKKK